MSTPFPTSVLDAGAPANRLKLPPSRWLREPLLHFALLGVLLFTLDHYFVSRADDPRTIVVSTETENEAKQLFTASRGREPNAEELQSLRQVWLDNEVLYREGLALQVDKGDPAIRDRVIFKALSVIDANVKLPAVDEKVLRDWFERHRDKYDDPVRYNFQDAALAGENSEAAVRSFVAALNAGAPGDSKAGLRVFKERPRANIEQSYGAYFPSELEMTRPGLWTAMQTRDGWRAIRVDSIKPARPAVFEAIANVVLQDWKDAKASEQRTAAVRAMQKKYKVTFENLSR